MTGLQQVAWLQEAVGDTGSSSLLSPPILKDVLAPTPQASLCPTPTRPWMPCLDTSPPDLAYHLIRLLTTLS